MSSNIGKYISLQIFGESHGKAIGAVIDGLPAGVELNFDKIAEQMADVVHDHCFCLLGHHKGASIPAPIAVEKYAVWQFFFYENRKMDDSGAVML